MFVEYRMLWRSRRSTIMKQIEKEIQIFESSAKVMTNVDEYERLKRKAKEFKGRDYSIENQLKKVNRKLKEEGLTEVETTNLQKKVNQLTQKRVKVEKKTELNGNNITDVAKVK